MNSLKNSMTSFGYNSKAYRLFSFWDKIEGNEVLVVATHGILKKHRKHHPKKLKKQKKSESNILKTRQEINSYGK
jgi:hypothetical protein